MSLKKILIAYSSRPPIIEYLGRALRKRGVEVSFIFSDDNTWFDKTVIHHVNKTAHNLRLIPKTRNFFSSHPLAHLHFRSNNLLEKVRRTEPDLVFIVRGIRFRDDVMQEIRKRAAIFGWWIEREERMEEAFREAGLFDHYFFMNSSCVEEGRKRGIDNISLLHHSVDPETFRPVKMDKKYDWCFVGNWSPKRQSVIERALKVSKNGVIWGPKWVKNNLLNFSINRMVKGDYIDGAELVKLYNETRVVLNITNWGFGEGEKRSGMNMRVLEVPACGAALLTDSSKDLRNVVTPGRHVIVYESIGEFTDKLSYYLSNNGELEKIAAAGRAHVAANYTYDHVASAVIERFEGLKRIGAQAGR